MEKKRLVIYEISLELQRKATYSTWLRVVSPELFLTFKGSVRHTKLTDI